MSPADSPAPTASGPQRDRRWLLLTAVVCTVIAAATIFVGSHRDGLRNPDEAHYVEQARTFLERGAFELDFIRFHVEQQPADITHPENLYPPGNGLLLAAGRAIAGENDFGSALPSTLIATLVLPLLGYALARALGAGGAFAFGCAVTVLFDRLVRDHAYQGLADLPLTAAVTLATLCALRPGRGAAILGGLALAAGFWFKPAALLFAPGLFLAHLIAERRPWRAHAGRLAWFCGAFAVAACPWPIRNLLVHGDPLYSVNGYLTAAANDPQFSYYMIRRVFWLDEQPAIEFGQSVASFGVGAWLKRFVSHLHEIIVVHGAPAFGLPFVIAAVLLYRQRRTLATLTVIVGYCLALAAVFAIYPRYLLAFLPLVAAVTWAAADRIATAVSAHAGELFDSRLWQRRELLALLFAAVAAIPGAADLALDLRGKAFVNYRDKGAVQAAAWLQEHEPDPDAVVVMAHEALRLHHTTGHKTVNCPWDHPPAIEAVVQHYGIDYAVQTHDGDSARESNRFFVPYLEAYGGRWREVELPSHYEFSLYLRKGGDADR